MTLGGRLDIPLRKEPGQASYLNEISNGSSTLRRKIRAASIPSRENGLFLYGVSAIFLKCLAPR